MKKNLVRLLTMVTMMVFFLFGCGKDQVATTNEEPKEEVVEAETQTELQQPEAEKEEIQEEEKETGKEEMPEAQITTTVRDITEFVKFMAEIGDDTPHIVIYNEEEGYIIDMKEGEYYQLKLDDRIYFNSNLNLKEISYSIPAKDYIGGAEAAQIIPDYDKFDSPHECRYRIVLKDDPSGEGIKLTCYLDAPTD